VRASSRIWTRRDQSAATFKNLVPHVDLEKRMRVPRGTPSLVAEDGFAVPTVFLAILAAFGLASAAVVSSINAQRGTVRDQETKAALATAEAGIANAMLRYNRISSEDAACAPVGGTGAGAGGWCPVEVSGDVDRGDFTYWVRPTPTELEVVALGAVDGTVRRVNAVAASAQGSKQGLNPFIDAGVIGLDGIHLNSNAHIKADVATNGNIGLDANSGLECEGGAQVGKGKGISPDNGGTITCDLVEGSVTLPPVNAGAVATENSNHRICNLDPLTPTKKCDQSWFPAESRLSLNPGTALTLGAAGGEFNYFFCQITLNSNSYLYIAGGAKVKIYLGNEDDGCQSWQVQSPLNLNSNSHIEPTGTGAADLAILVSGPGENAPSWLESRIAINSNTTLFDCEQSFVLYAPDTYLTVNSNTTICGGVAMKGIIVNSNSALTVDNTGSDFELPETESQYFLGYGTPEFVECTSVVPGPTESPDSGC
jgi:type II secretory pathway pseudopilin PulG